MGRLAANQNGACRTESQLPNKRRRCTDCTFLVGLTSLAEAIFGPRESQQPHDVEIAAYSTQGILVQLGVHYVMNASRSCWPPSVVA